MREGVGGERSRNGIIIDTAAFQSVSEAVFNRRLKVNETLSVG